MKKLIIILVTLFMASQLFCQEIFTSSVNTETSIYINGDVKMVLLNKYDVLKTECVEKYFPSLSSWTILIGEDLIGFLDKENIKTGIDCQAAVFRTSKGILYMVFNGNYFFSKDEMIRLICHELAHYSSGSFEHDSPEYLAEMERLFFLGIDIATHKDKTLLNECIR